MELGRVEGNVTIYCPKNSSLSSNEIHTSIFELVVELYLISVFCLIGLMGNIVVLVVLRRDHERREPMMLLQFLAVADAMYLLIAVFRYPTKYLMPDYNMYMNMQLYIFPMLKTAQSICIWMMLLVTIDRYVYVCVPLRAIQILSPRNRRLLAVLVIICGILYNLPRFFDSCIMTFKNACTGQILLSQKVYAQKFNHKLYFDLYMNAAYLIFLYIGPLVTLAVLNTKLVRAIKHSRKRHNSIGAHTDNNESNATLVLIVIVVVFIVCETPELIVTILSNLDRWSERINISMPLLRIFSTVNEFLMVINSSSNFFIYIAFGQRFRLVMRETVKTAFGNGSTVMTYESEPLQLQPQ